MIRTLALMTAAVGLVGCGDGVDTVAAPTSAEMWSQYVSETLIPSSLPVDTQIELIEQARYGDWVMVAFSLSETADLSWIGDVRSLPTSNTAESFGQLRASDTIEVLLNGDVCDAGVGWRYLIVDTGAGGAQRLGPEAAVCQDLGAGQ